jgi:hypothetical protein
MEQRFTFAFESEVLQNMYDGFNERLKEVTQMIYVVWNTEHVLYMEKLF